MGPIPIEQALYSNAAGGGYRFLARSPGFAEDWLAEAERLCTGFGERPAGVACPAAVFGQPFGLHHVAVVQVADQGADDSGRPGALAFRLLVISRKEYETFLGDPFAIAERFPPAWEARGTLPTLSWPLETTPPRTVAQVQKILQPATSATYLGGAQALVDGSRIVFERAGPDNDLVRNLWALLPYSTRGKLWPATFAFGNALRFDVLVVPRADDVTYASYLNEEQAGDYPEGRYELALQTAAEAGDQRGLDDLFHRRSSTQTLKLALVILVGFCLLAGAMQMLRHRPDPPTPPVAPLTTKRTEPPLDKDFPARMPDAMRVEVARGLKALMKDLGIPISGNPDIRELLATLDQKLGSPDRQRDPGPLKDHGPLERQLRTLLWKHHVDGFDDARLNGAELVERLHQKLAADPPKGKS